MKVLLRRRHVKRWRLTVGSSGPAWASIYVVHRGTLIPHDNYACDDLLTLLMTNANVVGATELRES